MQFVAGSQPVNALAFVVDGLYYGVSDFGYAAYSMVYSFLHLAISNIKLRFSFFFGFFRDNTNLA